VSNLTPRAQPHAGPRPAAREGGEAAGAPGPPALPGQNEARLLKASGLFRKAALDRLTSAEQLEQLVQIERPLGWPALALLLAVLAMALVWIWTGSIAVQAEGRGVLRRGAGPAPPSQWAAVLTVPEAQGRQIEPGMTAVIGPADGAPDGWTGEVRRVTSSGAGRAVEVEIALRPGPAGPDAGRMVRGSILLRRERPLDLLLPAQPGGGR
jgi:hypothetical protein